MYKSLLSCSVLALLCAGSFAQADTPPIDQTFFNVGGPNKAALSAAPTTTVPSSAVPAAIPSASTNQPAPMPNPALFTQVQNLSEQTTDNAVDIFGLGKRAQAKAASANPTAGTAAGTTVATAAQPAGSNLPDPSLFTNTGTPNEQTRDHPFKLF